MWMMIIGQRTIPFSVGAVEVMDDQIIEVRGSKNLLLTGPVKDAFDRWKDAFCLTEIENFYEEADPNEALFPF